MCGAALRSATVWLSLRSVFFFTKNTVFFGGGCIRTTLVWALLVGFCGIHSRLHVLSVCHLACQVRRAIVTGCSAPGMRGLRFWVQAQHCFYCGAGLQRRPIM